MNYQQTLDYLYQQLPMFHRIGKAAYKADLSNTIALCEQVGNSHHKFKSIHVAGTNGKGSTSHLLAALLQSAGYKTGLYTSPHLKSFTERIRINGKEIEQQAVVNFVEQHRNAIEQINPSFFEMTVAMAFDYFARERVEIAVIEVGLGGRLDSTNIILPEVSVITNISFDHQDILGDTLPLIAAEKAGIIKENVPVVISEYQPEVASVFQNKASEEKAPIFFATETFNVVDRGLTGQYRMVEVLYQKKSFLNDLKCQLLGYYQLKNIPGVLQAAEVLKSKGYTISEEAIRKAFSQVTTLTGLKGRWQILGHSPLTICDTGHNEGGIKEIVEQINALPVKNIYCVFGTVKDKDVSLVLRWLPKKAYYFFCQANIPRAMPAEELLEAARKFDLQGIAVADVNKAIVQAKKMASPEDMIFIGGSTFVVAEIDAL